MQFSCADTQGVTRKYQSTDSGSNGPSVAQEPKQNKSRQANPSVDQTSPTPSSWGQLAARAGRPTYRSAARPMGPTALTLPRGASLLLLQVGLGCCGRWLPPINTKGGQRIGHTHTHLTSLISLAFLAQSLGLVEFRRSLGVFESPELLESLVWVHLQLSLVIFGRL